MRPKLPLESEDNNFFWKGKMFFLVLRFFITTKIHYIEPH